MKILAIEFSSSERSAAVLHHEGTRAPLTENETVVKGQSGLAGLGLVEAALQSAKIEREQIDCVAVGLGPGSYTGIRCAIALAQGWELARGTRLLGISSAECLAAQAHAEGMMGAVHILIDAQRNEFYMASYSIDSQGWTEIAPLGLATFEEAKARLNSGGLPAGSRHSGGLPRRPGSLPSRRDTRQGCCANDELCPGSEARTHLSARDDIR